MVANLVVSVRHSRTFASLQHRNYRLLWSGTLISHTGDWMDQLSLNWLILELTGSPFYLGLVNLCRAIPILLFTLLGGVAADRVERRKLMIATQTVYMVLAFVLATLVAIGHIRVWQIFVIAALRGTTMSFNLPARQSLISDLVPYEDLPNAIALNSVTMNLTKILGPSIAGVLIGIIGVAGCFYVNGLSFVAVLWTLQAMVFPKVETKVDEGGVWQNLLEGFRYMRGQRTIVLLIVLALVPTFFGQPYTTMLAVFARDVLAIGATGLGVLTSCIAIGAIAGGLALASLEASAPRGAIMLTALVCFGGFLVLFAYSPWPLVSALLLVGAGAMNTTYGASNSTLLQLAVPDEFRGRVLSTLYITRGLVPLGTSLAGTLAVLVGVRQAVAAMAAVIILLVLALAAVAPTLRRLR